MLRETVIDVAPPRPAPTGTVVSKKVGWYKVQLDGAEDVSSFRLADLCNEEEAATTPSSPLENHACAQSPLKRKAPSSPLSNNASQSPLKRNASSSPLKRIALSSPLKGAGNASPSPAARAAVAVAAGTPGRRVAAGLRGSGMPPRCPSSTPAGVSVRMVGGRGDRGAYSSVVFVLWNTLYVAYSCILFFCMNASFTTYNSSSVVVGPWNTAVVV